MVNVSLFRPPAKQTKLITIGGLAMLLIASIVTIRLSNPNVGFKYFEPTHLPPGTSIKERRIAISFDTAQVEQNFRTEDWVYSISEYKTAKRLGSDTIGSANQDYDPKSVKPTCSIMTSPAGMRYRLCHWIDYGRIDVHEVKFIKGGTYVRANIPTMPRHDISILEINKFVDSFQEKSTFGLPVLRANGA